jgi:hypothetical protein
MPAALLWLLLQQHKGTTDTCGTPLLLPDTYDTPELQAVKHRSHAALFGVVFLRWV